MAVRSRNEEELKKHHVIITTYGTLRSDIKLFMEMPLDYVMLDESQAIKNPASKVTKAACFAACQTSFVHERYTAAEQYL